MAWKSGYPIYKIVILAISLLFMGATFLPLLYSIVFPNQDLQTVVSALKEQGEAPPEAAAIVDKVLGSAGPLTKAIKIGYYWGTTVAFHADSGPEKVRVSQATYIAWFQKRGVMLLVITRYAVDSGRKAYNISRASWPGVVRAYVIPIGFFVGALFLMRRKAIAR